MRFCVGAINQYDVEPYTIYYIYRFCVGAIKLY